MKVVQVYRLAPFQRKDWLINRDQIQEENSVTNLLIYYFLYQDISVNGLIMTLYL